MSDTLCILAERKPSKARPLDAIAKVCSNAKFIHFSSLSLAGFPETADAAEQALAFSTKPVKTQFVGVVKQKILGWQYNASRRYFEANPTHVAVSWNGMKGTRRVYMQGARDAGARCLFVEHAPLPEKITIDPVGINFTNSLPRNGEFYLDWAQKNGGTDREIWQAVKPKITARAAKSGYDTERTGAISNAGNYIFCPLQVPSDTQIRVFGGWVQSVENMLRVLERASQELPKGWHLRLKEHPSSDVSFKDLIKEIVSRSSDRIHVDNETDTFEQVARSKAVLTINSSVGLEAMFYEKPVIILGQAFYGFNGLVSLADSEARLVEILGTADNLTINHETRTAFLNYLIKEYYPDWSQDGDGRWILDPIATLKKLER